MSSLSPEILQTPGSMRSFHPHLVAACKHIQASLCVHVYVICIHIRVYVFVSNMHTYVHRYVRYVYTYTHTYTCIYITTVVLFEVFSLRAFGMKPRLLSSTASSQEPEDPESCWNKFNRASRPASRLG